MGCKLAAERLVMLYIQLVVLNKQGARGDDTESDSIRVFINSLHHEARCILCKFADRLNYVV